MIQILKASAGSGKTYNLARTYIRLLLVKQDPQAYRHILAVTFTNKATDEMKRRILKELHILATRPGDSPYFPDFVPSLFPAAPSLQKRAAGQLGGSRHDQQHGQQQGGCPARSHLEEVEVLENAVLAGKEEEVQDEQDQG